MISVKKTKRKRLTPGLVRIEITGTPAGLAKSRKLIKVARSMEIQFMKLCSQIQLDDHRQARSEKQRNEREAKRQSA